MSSDGLSSRLCTLNVLMAVFDGRKPLDESLDKFARKYNLSDQDKSFVHALCGFVLRYKDALQNQIDAHAHKTPPSAVNIILLIGVAQIKLMNSVPDHAAVDTCVDLCKKVKCDAQKGMVNAVLRNIIRGGEVDLKPLLPRWVVDTWVKDYGEDIARQIEKASLEEAKIGVSNKKGHWSILPSLRKQGSDDRDPRLRGESNITLSPDEWVQDYSSAKPVSLLGNIQGKSVLDLCAAPGGKTMQLAAKGAKVTAVDVSAKRLQRLNDNLDRTGLADQVEVICADLLKWTPDRTYDIVLLDAPCSATGTIRRHPDLPYIRTAKDIKTLVSLQQKLLNRAKGWVDQDGVFVYCTCSLQKAEGEEQAAAFLDQNPDMHRIHQDIRLMPQDGDRDGFFIARFAWR